jgi:hypothetical protein
MGFAGPLRFAPGPRRFHSHVDCRQDAWVDRPLRRTPRPCRPPPGPCGRGLEHDQGLGGESCSSRPQLIHTRDTRDRPRFLGRRPGRGARRLGGGYLPPRLREGDLERLAARMRGAAEEAAEGDAPSRRVRGFGHERTGGVSLSSSVAHRPHPSPIPPPQTPGKRGVRASTTGEWKVLTTLALGVKGQVGETAPRSLARRKPGVRFPHLHHPEPLGRQGVPASVAQGADGGRLDRPQPAQTRGPVHRVSRPEPRSGRRHSHRRRPRSEAGRGCEFSQRAEGKSCS